MIQAGRNGISTAASASLPGLSAGDAGGAAASGLRLGVVNLEEWRFLDSLHRRLSARYETSVFARRATRAPFFRERIARSRLRLDLQSFLRRHDVVFVEWASEMLALASHLPKRCALVTRLHRYEMYAWADRIDWSAVDAIILVSRAKQREFAGRFPAHAHKTVVIPVGIPLQAFPFVARPFSGNLGTLCHISPRKRIYDLVLALAGSLQSDPRLRLVIGGAPMPEHRDYYEAILRLVRQLGLTDRVVFDGRVDDAASWYAKIDVFISHSYSEGMQVAPAEAMASGCFTLSHDWEGADELLPDDCRYVTDAGLIGHVNRYRDLSEPARQVLRRRMRALATEHADERQAHASIEEVILRCARVGEMCRT